MYWFAQGSSVLWKSGSMGQRSSRCSKGQPRGISLAALLAAIAPCAVYSQTQKQRTDMAAHIIGLNMVFLEVCLQPSAANATSHCCCYSAQQLRLCTTTGYATAVYW